LEVPGSMDPQPATGLESSDFEMATAASIQLISKKRRTVILPVGLCTVMQTQSTLLVLYACNLCIVNISHRPVFWWKYAIFSGAASNVSALKMPGINTVH